MASWNKHFHKSTWCCPLLKCKYTSRIMIGWNGVGNSTMMDNKLSSHSENCPHHQLKLIPIAEKEILIKAETKKAYDEE